MNEKYDIGLVCLLNNNYGNNLTYYALYRILKDKGYSTLLIEKPLNTPWKTYSPKLSLFLEMPFDESDIAIDYVDRLSIKELNERCRIFLLGSDQLFRSTFIEGLDFYPCMDWVREDKYKMAYATSFGVDTFEGSNQMRAKMAYYLSRFDAISVREETGVDILRNQFAISGEHVIDPVFLCNVKAYQELIDKSTMEFNEAFVGAYILDPSFEKEKMIRDLCDKVNCAERIIFSDGEQSNDDLEKKWNLKFTHNNSIEDWLANIQNCKLFITDSFHGLCFALIFKKNFYVIFKNDSWRGKGRIVSFLTKLGLQDYILSDYGQIPVEIVDIDYRKVDKILSNEINRSKEWLLKHIEKGFSTVKAMSAYDILDEKLDRSYEENNFLQERLHGVDNWIGDADNIIKNSKKVVSEIKKDIDDLSYRLHGVDNWIGDTDNIIKNSKKVVSEIKKDIDDLSYRLHGVDNWIDEAERVQRRENDLRKDLLKHIDQMENDINAIKEEIVWLRKGKISRLIEKIKRR